MLHADGVADPDRRDRRRRRREGGCAMIAPKSLDEYVYDDLAEHWVLKHRSPGLFFVQLWGGEGRHVEACSSTIEGVAGDIRAYTQDVFGFEFCVETEQWKGVQTIVIYCPWQDLPTGNQTQIQGNHAAAA